MAVSGDIIAEGKRDWLVIGWFTPDYRPLANKLAANLAEHGAHFHLFAKPALGTWNTRRKPEVVLEAMDRYPGKTLVLMDVDCVVRGNITPAADILGDVGIIVIARNQRRRRRVAHWLAMECSSRVVVFRPTDKARAFAETWADTIERSDVNHDEHSMAWAYLASPSVDFEYIDQAYSGRELGQVAGAVIEHDSAHDEQRRARRGPIRQALRAFERRFLRSGRSQESRLQGALSVARKA